MFVLETGTRYKCCHSTALCSSAELLPDAARRGHLLLRLRVLPGKHSSSCTVAHKWRPLPEQIRAGTFSYTSCLWDPEQPITQSKNLRYLSACRLIVHCFVRHPGLRKIFIFLHEICQDLDEQIYHCYDKKNGILMVPAMRNNIWR